MTFVTANYPDNAPAQSVARAAANAANAAMLCTLSRGLTAAGVTTGTTTSKAKTVNTFNYTVGGKFFTKAATDDFWTLGVALSNTTVPVSAFQKYLLLIDTTGAATVQEGLLSKVNAAGVAWSNVSAVSPWAPVLSVLADTKVVVATMTIATDATHTFIPGTTLFGAAGITATFIDGMDQSFAPFLANMVGTIFGSI